MLVRKPEAMRRPWTGLLSMKGMLKDGGRRGRNGCAPKEVGAQVDFLEQRQEYTGGPHLLAENGGGCAAG